MSNTDSFIDEVSEEIRRDKITRWLRRYGWMVAAAIALIIAGAAYNEWRKASARAEAQALGNALIDSLSAETPSERLDALAGVTTDGEGRVVVDLLRAAEAEAAEDPEAAAEMLRTISETESYPAIYRDLAALKRVVLLGDALSEGERRDILVSISSPGGAFRLLADEQLALLELETGAREAAIQRLRAIVSDVEVTDGLRSRASRLIIALGAEPGAA